MMGAAAPIGHNAPPDPFVLYSESIEDLLIEANNYLDGKEIENEEQEAAVASILTRLRRESNAADDQRKAEKKPHDEAGDAVQAKWKPLLAKADLAVTVAKNALTSFLRKKDEAQRAAAQAAAQEARRLAEAAAQTQPRADDLAGQTVARHRQEAAVEAQKKAERLAKAPVQAKGGERKIGLRTSWITTVTDPLAFGKWAWEHRRAEYEQFLNELAKREGRQGPRDIPGLTITPERKAT